ncbi:MAG: hypothetical protein VYC44_00935, partial [Chloroflexota bacterium]|nr:hypothetical protein [Chloroflexota bacterium]
MCTINPEDTISQVDVTGNRQGPTGVVLSAITHEPVFKDPTIKTPTENQTDSGRPIFYGWYIVIAAGLVVFSSGPGQSYVFSIFIDSIIEDTGLSRPGISALYMASTGMSAVLVAFVSRLADRYGPRAMLVAIG